MTQQFGSTPDLLFCSVTPFTAKCRCWSLEAQELSPLTEDTFTSCHRATKQRTSLTVARQCHMTSRVLLLSNNQARTVRRSSLSFIVNPSATSATNLRQRVPRLPVRHYLHWFTKLDADSRPQRRLCRPFVVSRRHWIGLGPPSRVVGVDRLAE